MKGIVQLLPLEASDRERFIADNQEAFNFGAKEEFGLRDDHEEEEGQITSREFLARYEEILADDGLVEFKTDNRSAF